MPTKPSQLSGPALAKAVAQAYTYAYPLVLRGIGMTDSPQDQIVTLTNSDCGRFFTQFCALMAAGLSNPPDPAMESLLSTLGLIPGSDIHWAQTMTTADFTIAQTAAMQALHAIKHPATAPPHRRPAETASSRTDQRAPVPRGSGGPFNQSSSRSPSWAGGTDAD